MKKFVSLLLALLMVMSMASAWAESKEDASLRIALVYPRGTEGSITVANPVAGHTYTAYKIFDLAVASGNYLYTIAPTSEWFTLVQEYADANTTLVLTPVNNGAVYIVEIKEGFSAADFAEHLYGKDGANVTDKEGTALAADADGKPVAEGLGYGYYFVTSSLGSLCALTTNDPDATIYEKNDTPELEKKIDGDKDTADETEGPVDATNAAIGDKVPYVLTSEVPAMVGYEKYYFVVTDTMSEGLTFNDDIVIKIGEETLDVNTDYTVTVTNNANGTTTIKIVFVNFIQHAAKVGQEIKITYSATLNEKAVIGEEGNPNSVHLVYSNDPNSDESGNTGNEPGPNSPVEKTPEDKTYTYVTEVVLEKVNSQTELLPGATFELTGTRLNIVLVTGEVFKEADDGSYYKLTNGSYTETAPTDETADQYESTTVKYKLEYVEKAEMVEEEVRIIATTGADGTITFSGLSAGEYTITEIIAPDGYNLLPAPITVTIGWGAPEDVDEATKDNCTWTYSWSNGDTDKTITVVNTNGSELPETGGMGTTVLYIVGGALMLAAFVLIVSKRRATEN